MLLGPPMVRMTQLTSRLMCCTLLSWYSRKIPLEHLGTIHEHDSTALGYDGLAVDLTFKVILKACTFVIKGLIFCWSSIARASFSLDYISGIVYSEVKFTNPFVDSSSKKFSEVALETIVYVNHASSS